MCVSGLFQFRKISLGTYPSKDEVDKTKAETGNKSVTFAGSGLSEDRGTVECYFVLMTVAYLAILSAS